jgi:hypothetical protein
MGGCLLGQSDLSKADKTSKQWQRSRIHVIPDYRNSISLLVVVLMIAACILPASLPAFGLEEKNSDNAIYLKYVDQVKDLQGSEVLPQSIQLKVEAFGDGQTLVDGLGNNTLSGNVIPSRLNFELRQSEEIARNVTLLVSVYDESKERAGSLVFRDLLSTGYGIFNLIMYDQKTNSSSIIDHQDPIFFRLLASDGSTHTVSSSRRIGAEGDYRVEIEIYRAEITGNVTKAIIQTHLPITITYYWDGKGILSKTPFNPARNEGQWTSEFDVIVIMGCIVSLTILATKTHTNWKSLPSIFHRHPKEQEQDEAAIVKEEEGFCQYKQVEIPQIGIGINQPNKTFTELYNELSELGLNTNALRQTDLSECELEDLCYAMKQLRMTYQEIEEKDRA